MSLGKRLRDFFNRPSAKEVEAFITAAAVGNEKAVGEYCKKYPHHVDAPNKKGLTALQIAAIMNDLAVGNILLEAKADPNRPAQFGHSPFFASAAKVDDYRLLDAMLKAGANVNFQSIAWLDNPMTLSTPLMAAAYVGDKKRCEYLIKHGADPTQKDIGGATARAYATYTARSLSDLEKVNKFSRAHLGEVHTLLGVNETKKSLRNTATFLKKAQKEWVKQTPAAGLKI